MGRKVGEKARKQSYLFPTSTVDRMKQEDDEINAELRRPRQNSIRSHSARHRRLCL